MTRWWSACLFGHGERLYTRDAAGVLTWACDRCQQPLGPVLSGEMITTPLPQDVRGVPPITARRVVKANVATMRRNQR